MALLSSSWLLDILILVVTLLYLVYHKCTSYFHSRGIPYLKPVPLLGHPQIFFGRPQIEACKILYESFPKERFFGFFQATKPSIIVRDPELAHRIMVQDFSHFYDRGFPSMESDLFSKTLFVLKGQTWKNLRHKLIPTFTSGKIKGMFSQFLIAGEHMLEEADASSSSGEAIDVKSLTTNFATEVVGTAAFGIDFSKENPETKRFIQKLDELQPKSKIRPIILAAAIAICPKLLNFLKIGLFPSEPQQYFVNIISSNKEYRVKNNIKRNDFFQLLLKLQEEELSGKAGNSAVEEEDTLINQMDHVPQSSQVKPERVLTDEGMTAQAFMFVIAGLDILSGVVNLALYHIAKDPGVQQRLAEEVDSVLRAHGAWLYQAVKEMTYLDQIIQETIRMYAPVSFHFREVSVPYQIPDTDIVLEKGTPVIIPIGAIQMDPAFYPSPEVFNPDRFADNNHKPNSKYTPFGDGPRICIGMRFAIVEVKACLAKVVSRYSLEVDNKTQEPLEMDPKSFSPKPKSGIWLKFKKRSNCFIPPEVAANDYC